MRDAEEDLRICDAATIGPWTNGYNGGITGPTAVQLNWCDCDDYERWENGMVTYPLDYESNGVICRTMPDSPNTDFIAMSRESLPYWINRAVELEKSLNLYDEFCTAIWKEIDFVQNNDGDYQQALVAITSIAKNILKRFDERNLPLRGGD